MNFSDLAKYLSIIGPATMIGQGASNLFPNPADESMKYLNTIPKTINDIYNPWEQPGKKALNIVKDEYGNLISNPGGKINDIGSHYQQSPGYKFAMEQAMQAAGHSAAAGGMAGSPAAQQEAQRVATGLADQDYYKWLEMAKGLYEKGLGGEQDIMHQGFDASKERAQQIAQTIAAQSALKYAGTANRNTAFSNLIGGAIGAGVGLLL